MTFVRAVRWVVLVSALVGSIGWAYVSINRLLDFSMNPEQRVAQYTATSQPVPEYRHQMENSQQYWGRQGLFAIALAFLFLLALLVNWVLDGRQPLRK